MVATMDLNASPQPEEEEDDEPYVRHLEDGRIESAVEIARRVGTFFISFPQSVLYN